MGPNPVCLICLKEEAVSVCLPLYDFTYVWNLKNKTVNKHNKQKQSCRYREQTGGCQRMGRLWGRKEIDEGRLRGRNFQLQNK